MTFIVPLQTNLMREAVVANCISVPVADTAKRLKGFIRNALGEMRPTNLIRGVEFRRSNLINAEDTLTYVTNVCKFNLQRT